MTGNTLGGTARSECGIAGSVTLVVGSANAAGAAKAKARRPTLANMKANLDNRMHLLLPMDPPYSRDR